jgi:predicted nucleotidyltransferase
MNVPSEAVERINTYVAGIAAAYGGDDGGLASIVVFGSAATGGYATGVSDVDLLIVLADEASPAYRECIARVTADLELGLGLAKRRVDQERAMLRTLRGLVDRITANVRTFFICSKADLLSGEPGRILDLPRFQAAFTDRITIPSIVGSGITMWGEELLSQVPIPPIRRRDVAKAWFGLFNQALVAAAVYPLLPEATRYAMEALKRSVHGCYVCYHGRTAPLTDEIAFFEEQYAPDPAFGRLMTLRRSYRKSFRFILHSIRAIARLHALTARDAHFPKTAGPLA